VSLETNNRQILKIQFMKTKMFYTGLLATLLAVIVFISCKKNNSYGSGSNAPSAAAVSIKNMAFSPGNLSVMTGATVTWTNSDTTIHTVTADDGSFNSGNIAVGATYSRVFSTAGTVSYHCTLHPEMTGKVVVTGTTSGGGGY
jgi:plastocyanin